MKTMLHTIRWSSKVSHLKLATHYSSLFVNDNETTFSQKKIEFRKMWRKEHTTRHRPTFLQICVATKNKAKKVVWIRQKTTYSGKRILQKSFSRKTQESWWISLHTLFVFRRSFVIRPFLWLSAKSVYQAKAYFFSSHKKSRWVRHGDRSPSETRWTEFRKKITLQNTFYALFVVRTNFVVSFQFRCGWRIVCSSLHGSGVF